MVPGKEFYFVKLKQFQKSEKNSEVQAPTRIFFLTEILCVFVLFSCFQMFPKKWIGGWAGGVRLIRVFLGFFQLDKTPPKVINNYKETRPTIYIGNSLVWVGYRPILFRPRLVYNIYSLPGLLLMLSGYVMVTLGEICHWLSLSLSITLLSETENPKSSICSLVK